MYQLGRFPLVYKAYKAVYFRANKVATQSLQVAFARQMGEGKPGGKIGPRYFKFCFVRNPYDRLVSCWLNQLANPTEFSRTLFQDGMHKGFWDCPGIVPGMDFKTFARAVAMIDDASANPHFKPQWLFFSDEITGEFMPDFVGRFETIQRDYNFICKTIGIETETLPVKNKSAKRRHWQSYYDAETLQIVGERYEKDFRLFGYSRLDGVGGGK